MTDFYSQNRCVCSTRSHGPLLYAFCLCFHFNDSSLTRFFEKADLEFPEHSRNPLASWFVLEDGLLYRMVKSSDETKPLSQLMVPTSARLKVLRLGHESAFAGHLGVKKPFDCIVYNFYWPGIFARVRRYCASCDICQRTVKKTVCRVPHCTVSRWWVSI